MGNHLASNIGLFLGYHLSKSTLNSPHLFTLPIHAYNTPPHTPHSHHLSKSTPSPHLYTQTSLPGTLLGPCLGLNTCWLVVAVWLQWVIKPEPKWVRLAIARKEYLAKERARGSCHAVRWKRKSLEGDTEN